jgi:hypothetical protein
LTPKMCSLCTAACVHVQASSIRACLSFSVLDWRAQRIASSAYSRNGSAFDIDPSRLRVALSCGVCADASGLYKIAHSVDGNGWCWGPHHRSAAATQPIFLASGISLTRTHSAASPSPIMISATSLPRTSKTPHYSVEFPQSHACMRGRNHVISHASTSRPSRLLRRKIASLPANPPPRVVKPNGKAI